MKCGISTCSPAPRLLPYSVVNIGEPEMTMLTKTNVVDFYVYTPYSKLWEIRDVNGNYDVAEYYQGSITALVTDNDGDGATYTVWQYGSEIASGYVPGSPEYDDFYWGIKLVEDVLVRKGFLFRPTTDCTP
jgi:hypothetical protein